MKKGTGIITLAGIIVVLGGYWYVQGLSVPRVELKKFTHNDARYTIHIEYPVFSGNAAAQKASAVMQSYVDERVATFKKDVDELYTDNTYRPPEQRVSALEMKYTSELVTDKLISGEFTYYQNFAFAAHPMHGTEVFNYDLRSQRELALADLFAPGADYQTFLIGKIKPQLQEEFTKREMKQEPFTEIWRATDATFTHFVLTQWGVRFFFDPYEVAAYAAGDFDAVVFWFELHSVLSPDLPIETEWVLDNPLG